MMQYNVKNTYWNVNTQKNVDRRAIKMLISIGMANDKIVNVTSGSNLKYSIINIDALWGLIAMYITRMLIDNIFRICQPWSSIDSTRSANFVFEELLFST
jgi:hypothetical protein